MADAFTGEIRIFAGNFAPYGWALCNGQLMAISSNTALFSLLGTQYGGDGRTTFALPNLMGSAPMNQGAGPGLTPRSVGEELGTESVTLLQTEIPAHTHIPQAVNAQGNAAGAESNIWAQSQKQGTPPNQTQANNYNTAANVSMSPVALNAAGSSQPHNNMQPYIAQTFIICLNGIYPSRG